MNILLMIAHSIEEYDQVRLLSRLGHDVFSLGGYVDPAHPHDPKRPALTEAASHPDLRAVVDDLGTPDNLDAAKRHTPEPLLEWADAIIVHHYERQWLLGQWPRLCQFMREGGRVIWRTVGQSAIPNEEAMAPLRPDGLEIVRYSPKERNIPGYAGEDSLIRFYKSPSEWRGWTGEDARVINITGDFKQRGTATNWEFWEAATRGVPRVTMGPGSEEIGGLGEVPLDEMQAWLRRARAYLYTGTQPASYTLGLIEAMMTGIPVISIGPSWHRDLPYGPLLFEAHEIVGVYFEDPSGARHRLEQLLGDHDLARMEGERQRRIAIELFAEDRISGQWRVYLG